MSEELYRYRREIDRVGDFPGADIERSLIKIAIESQDINLLEAIARSHVFDESTSKWVAVTKATAEGEFTNISKFGGTGVTGRDVSADFAKLQNLNITLGALSSDLRGSGAKTLTTLENDIQDILAQLDITLTSLRNDLRGVDLKNFSTLQSEFAPDASGLPKMLKDFYIRAVSVTVPSGEVWGITSGEEWYTKDLTVEGYLRNDGIIRNKGAITINGTLNLGKTGIVEVYE